jgi:hypothetical protein
MMLSGLEAVHSSEMSVAVTLHIDSFQRKAILIKFAFSIIVYLWVTLRFYLFLFYDFFNSWLVVVALRIM